MGGIKYIKGKKPEENSDHAGVPFGTICGWAEGKGRDHRRLHLPCRTCLVSYNDCVSVKNPGRKTSIK